VGGRYSLWSSIGVSLAIAIGRENFLALLAGGPEMDDHFRTAAWAETLPVLMAIAGIWAISRTRIWLSRIASPGRKRS